MEIEYQPPAFGAEVLPADPGDDSSAPYLGLAAYGETVGDAQATAVPGPKT